MDRASKLKLMEVSYKFKPGVGERIWEREKPTGLTDENKQTLKELLKKSKAEADNIEKFISELDVSKAFLFHIEWPDFKCIKKHTEDALKSIRVLIHNLELMSSEIQKTCRPLRVEKDGEVKVLFNYDDITKPVKLQDIKDEYAVLYKLEKDLDEQLSGIKLKKRGAPPEIFVCSFKKVQFIEPIIVLFEEYIGEAKQYNKGLFYDVVKKIFEMLDLPDPSHSIRTALENHKS